MNTTRLVSKEKASNLEVEESEHEGEFIRTSMRLQENIFWTMKAIAASRKMNLTELCDESFRETIAIHNLKIVSCVKKMKTKEIE